MAESVLCIGGDGTFYRDVGDSFQMIDEAELSRFVLRMSLLSTEIARLSYICPHFVP